jgi:hypothetical protein
MSFIKYLMENIFGKTLSQRAIGEISLVACEECMLRRDPVIEIVIPIYSENNAKYSELIYAWDSICVHTYSRILFKSLSGYSHKTKMACAYNLCSQFNEQIANKNWPQQIQINKSLLSGKWLKAAPELYAMALTVQEITPEKLGLNARHPANKPHKNDIDSIAEAIANTLANRMASYDRALATFSNSLTEGIAQGQEKIDALVEAEEVQRA